MECGIYCITNKINNKQYIGQSIDIKKRFREHCFSARHLENKDHNMPIHLAMAKYGIDNFRIDILELCNLNELDEKEIYWIEKKQSYINGYNATIGGQKNHQHLGTPIEMYDLDGKYIKEYPNITIAANDIGVSRNTLYGILFGNRLSAKGFQFKIKSSNKQITKYKNRQGGSIPIYQLDLNNTFIKKWDSTAQAARELNFDASTITKCCKGKLQTHHGYRWRYAND